MYPFGDNIYARSRMDGCKTPSSVQVELPEVCAIQAKQCATYVANQRDRQWGAIAGNVLGKLVDAPNLTGWQGSSDTATFSSDGVCSAGLYPTIGVAAVRNAYQAISLGRASFSPDAVAEALRIAGDVKLIGSVMLPSPIPSERDLSQAFPPGYYPNPYA